jgi:hypothetical protein
VICAKSKATYTKEATRVPETLCTMLNELGEPPGGLRGEPRGPGGAQAGFLTHPAELAWEADLATRLIGHIDEPAEPTDKHGQDHAQPELEAALQSIDLRTVNLGDRKPRTRLERAVRDALGTARHTRHPDVPRPPLPGHGIDGPDIGP